MYLGKKTLRFEGLFFFKVDPPSTNYEMAGSGLSQADCDRTAHTPPLHLPGVSPDFTLLVRKARVQLYVEEELVQTFLLERTD